MLRNVTRNVIRNLFGELSDPYAITGFSPKLVFDPKADVYRTGGNASTFADLVDYTGASNKTMVDSDGVLKWAPHNLLLRSGDFSTGSSGTLSATTGFADPDGNSTAILLTSDSADEFFRPTSAINVISSAQYTLKIAHRNLTGGTASIGAFDVTNGSVIGVQPISATSSTWEYTAYTFTIPSGCSSIYIYFANNVSSGASVEAAFPHLYRSDLGGMADNPDTGNSYVPTTSAARYLSRRNHHVYEGGEWVNAGMLVEPTAATNLVTYSNDFTNAAWVKTATTITAGAIIGPDGLMSGAKIENTGTSNEVRTDVVVTGTTAVLSCFFKQGSGVTDQTVLQIRNQTAGSNIFAVRFSLSDGIGAVLTGTGTQWAEDVGNGWWRFAISCAVTSGNTFRAAVGNGGYSSGVGKFSYIYGAQFEAGSVPSSYIPTSGSTATRAAETVSIAAEKLPFINPDNLGPELVTNGTFDTDTAWTKGTGWTISGGVANTVQPNNLSSLAQDGVFAASGYFVEFTVSSYVSGGISARFTGGGSDSGPSVTSNGRHSFFIPLTGARTKFDILTTGGSGATATIDNISVREVTALELSIAMRGRMTGGTLTPTRWYLNADNAILQQINTSDFTFTQEAATVVDSVTGGSFTSGINVPFSIASRHGSTFLNGAVDGTALTANLTPTSLPNLSATNLSLAFAGGPMIIEQFAMWDTDLADAGIAEASS